MHLTIRLAFGLAAVGLSLAGCDQTSSASPRQLSAISPRPAPSAAPATQTRSHRMSQKAAEGAVVRSYFRAVNLLPRRMDTRALVSITTPRCPCRKLVRSVRQESAHDRLYYGTTAINAIRVNVDGPALGDVVVDFDTTVSGLRSANGTVVTRTKPRHHVNLDFTVVRRDGRWLIERINEL